MKVLGIYGAGGLGKEVCIIAEKINAIEDRWNEILFIDDITKKTELRGNRILTFERAASEVDNLEVVIAQGEPRARETLYNKVTDRKIPLATLIHPGVYIDESTTIGEGTVVCCGAVITADVSIGINSYIQPYAIIGHDITIGSHTIIGSLAHIGGKTVIGDRVFMGFSSALSDRIKVGDDVIISGGSVVFRDLEDKDIAVGNPARVAKKNNEGKVFGK